MAQQITNNNLILDALTSTNNNFADKSSCKFDSILNIANKSFTKQSQDLTSANDSSPVTAQTLQSTQVNTNAAANNINKSNTTVTKQSVKNTSTDDSISTKTNQTSNKNIQTDTETVNNETTSQDTENSDTVMVVPNDTYTENTDDITAVTTEIVDVVSKYTYLQDAVDTDDIETLEDSSELDSDTDAVLNADIEIDTDDLSDALNKVSNETADNTQIINTAAQALVQSGAQLNNVTESAVSDDIAVNVDVAVDIDSDVQSTQNNKELISQKMVDELNVTIEEVSDASAADEPVDNTLMNSTEQAVKYSMEKDTKKEPEVSVENAEVFDTKDVKEEVVVEDVSEQNEDLIANSDEVADNIKSSDETNETVEPEIKISEDVETDSSQENPASEHDDMSDKKDEMKKESLSSNNTNSDDIPDVDVDGLTADSKIQTMAADVTGAGKPHIAGVTNTVGSQTTASQAPQTTNISKEDVIAQIHSKLQTMNNNSNTKLTMVLNPESLGKVSVQLTNSRDGVTAEMLVSSQNVKDMLDNNISNLKDTLTAQGVHVNEVTVKVAQSENNAEMDYTEQEGSQSNKQDQGKQQNEQENDKNKFEEMFLKNTQEEKDID